MSNQEIEVLVVGAGQAGIAMSEHLSSQGVPHLVVERDRIAERWRTGRWDSLVANGPAWHDRFPGRSSTATPTPSPRRSRSPTISPPTPRRSTHRSAAGSRCSSVRSATPAGRVSAWRHPTAVIEARYVVAATGPVPAPGHPGGRSRRRRDPSDPLQRVPQPATAARRAPSSSSAPDRRGCRSPTSCARPAAGSTSRSGRTTGRRDSYRGRDFCWWLGVLGKWDAAAPPRGAEHVTIAVSGAHGGHTVDFRRSRRQRHHAGRACPNRSTTASCTSRRTSRDNIEHGDANYLSMLDEADAYVARNGLDLPEEPRGPRSSAPIRTA